MTRNKVKWQWDWGIYIPVCPYCNEPAYDECKCLFCGKPYKWVDGKYKPTEVTVGEYTVVQSTNHHIVLYKNERMVMHIPHTKKMSEEELIEQISFYEAMCEYDKERANNENIKELAKGYATNQVVIINATIQRIVLLRKKRKL